MPSLKKLGEVKNISYAGKLLVRGNWAPRIGAKVFGVMHEPLGRVQRVFGPVSSPYVLVSPSHEANKKMLTLIGREVFIEK
mgnify:CR=1 FL=1